MCSYHALFPIQLEMPDTNDNQFQALFPFIYMYLYAYIYIYFFFFKGDVYIHEITESRCKVIQHEELGR